MNVLYLYKISFMLHRYCEEQKSCFTQPVTMIFRIWHSVRASYCSGKTSFSAQKTLLMTFLFLWISNSWPLKISYLNGLGVKGEYWGTSQLFLGLCWINEMILCFPVQWQPSIVWITVSLEPRADKAKLHPSAVISAQLLGFCSVNYWDEQHDTEALVGY